MDATSQPFLPIPFAVRQYRCATDAIVIAALLTAESAIARIDASPALRAAQTKWIERARTLLQPPAEVLKSKTDYTHDPAAIYRWRSALAEAIMEANPEPAG